MHAYRRFVIHTIVDEVNTSSFYFCPFFLAPGNNALTENVISILFFSCRIRRTFTLRWVIHRLCVCLQNAHKTDRAKRTAQENNNMAPTKLSLMVRTKQYIRCVHALLGSTEYTSTWEWCESIYGRMFPYGFPYSRARTRHCGLYAFFAVRMRELQLNR